MRLDFRKFILESPGTVFMGPLKDPEMRRWKGQLLRVLQQASDAASIGDQPDQFLRPVKAVIDAAPPRPEAASVSNALKMYIRTLDGEGDSRSPQGRASLLKQAIALVHRGLRGTVQGRMV